MKQLRRILTVIMMAAVLSVSAFTGTAFGQKNDNRPPKEKPQVKEKDKPPPSNSNSQNNNNRRKP